MKYISTRGTAPVLDFEDTLLAGLATDGGLYVPESWPSLSRETLASFKNKSYAEVAYEVLQPFIGGTPDNNRFRDILEEAYQAFEVPEVAPLVPLGGQHYLLELFHGPTLAFKDVAMQLLARLMDEALSRRGRRATIIGATSGDTGGAAIEAFRGRENIDIFILYPDGRVSDVQRKQMTTPTDANVHTLAIDGTFDDCQALVKAMFNDAAFRQETGLAGVNSINWARVMAQTVYYFTAAAQLGGPEKEIAFSVPTGNFGDIFAGYVAKQMGLPIAQLMIATNINDILARVLQTGIYEIGDVVASTSPSMDIQVSSNFERLLFEATGRNAEEVCRLMGELAETRKFSLSPEVLDVIRAGFAAERVDEVETAKIIKTMFEADKMLLDPHTAVGYGAAMRSDLPATTPIVTLATAHPAKFPASVEKACHRPAVDIISTPQRVQDMMHQEEHFVSLANSLSDIQDFIRHKQTP
ncbi:threonine synthase [alpha proteobacterium IMCC14465]|uniref:Threonine synthase n=1 Tax=alpha proteobacterium IMCC14465 TaxID=1220535 RepID=J9E093_9PROT|nr:threonine synthase [alpha proteobacterium IMCC14465]